MPTPRGRNRAGRRICCARRAGFPRPHVQWRPARRYRLFDRAREPAGFLSLWSPRHFTAIRGTSSSPPRGRIIKGASRFLETIADAIERLDHLKVVVHDLELLAQALDVAVDGAVVDIDLIVIGRVHERVAAFHHAGSGGE